MAKDLKEQDYDFMEVLDENEEIENLYDELTRERDRDVMIIAEQRELIVKQQEEMRAFMEEKELVIKEKEEQIATLQMKMKKRSREVFEGGSSQGCTGGDPKRFKLNNCHADNPGHGSGTRCNSAKYHRNCKGHDHSSNQENLQQVSLPATVKDQNKPRSTSRSKIANLENKLTERSHSSSKNVSQQNINLKVLANKENMQINKQKTAAALGQRKGQW